MSAGDLTGIAEPRVGNAFLSNLRMALPVRAGSVVMWMRDNGAVMSARVIRDVEPRDGRLWQRLPTAFGDVPFNNVLGVFDTDVEANQRRTECAEAADADADARALLHPLPVDDIALRLVFARAAHSLVVRPDDRATRDFMHRRPVFFRTVVEKAFAAFSGHAISPREMRAVGAWIVRCVEDHFREEAVRCLVTVGDEAP